MVTLFAFNRSSASSASDVFTAREREKVDGRDSSSSRGEYEPVESASSDRTSTTRKCLQLLPITALLLAGVALMLMHHFFYAYLGGQIIDDGKSNLPPLLRNQITPNIIGTIIAHAARIVLSMVVGVTFGQIFWETLRSRSHAIQQIDALVDCGLSPFRLSSIHAATAAPRLFLLSIIASGMTLIVILSPGALIVSSNVQHTEPCIVPTVPDLMNITDYNSFALDAAVEKVLATGSYIPPLQANICNTGASSCTYNVSFIGPTFQCFDITGGKDIPPITPNISKIAPEVLWNATADPQNFDRVFVSTWDMVNNRSQVNNCTAFPAIHEVGVTLVGSSVTAQVYNVASSSAGNLTNFMDSYTASAVTGIWGVVSAENGTLLESSEVNALPNSKMFVITPSGDYTWANNVTQVLTSYMHNVSISMLSGRVFYSTSNNTDVPQNMLFVNSTCSSTWNGYVYDPVRLLVAYGVALVLASLVMVPGCGLILRNGVEGKVITSHIVKSSLNPALFHHLKTANKEVHVSFKGENPGVFIPASTEPFVKSDTRDESNSKVRLSEATYSTGSKMCRKRNWLLPSRMRDKQMIFLVCVALCGMIIHHLYNSFLDGRPSTSSTGRLDWITDQSVVSYIGIALAFANHTLLSAALTIASTQIFWRCLRTHGHSISQIDALAMTQKNAFTPSIFRCGPAALIKFGMIFASLVASSMPLVSVFAPSSIKVKFNHQRSLACTIQAPRNLSSLRTPSLTDYSVQAEAVFLSENYLPPSNPCSGAFGSRCSYAVDFIGPGFDCRDVTAWSNSTAFENASFAGDDTPTLNDWFSSITGDDDDPAMTLSIQTWDVQKEVYRAINCTCITNDYSLAITHNASSTIQIINSTKLSPVLVDPGTNISLQPADSLSMGSANNDNRSAMGSFVQQFLYYSMWILVGDYSSDGSNEFFRGLFYFPNSLGSAAQGDSGAIFSDNVTWNSNMPSMLELYVQNLTFSILSGQIFTPSSPDGTDLLEDFPTTCIYTFTAYEYTPWRLLSSYGVAIFLTILCVITGYNAITQNNVKESMAFSRFLRAVLNERMLNAREKLDMDLVIKADNDKEGSFTPYIEPMI